MDTKEFDVAPNKFYKKIWFWLILLGALGFLVIVLIYLYADIISTTTAYVVAGLFFGVILVGVIISLFMKKDVEPTLKTFDGRDTKLTADQISSMNAAQLEETLALVSGIPVSAIRAVEDRKMSVDACLQFMPNSIPITPTKK